MSDKQVTTILFDLDGTLINTNELIIASFLHTLEHYYPSKYKREDVLHLSGRLFLIRSLRWTLINARI